MLGETVKELDLRPAIEETYWAGDPAVEGISDMESYVKEASPSALDIKQGEKPSKIRFRALTDREFLRVQTVGQQGGGDTIFAEACRYALVSVEGVKLDRIKEGGIRGLTDESLEMVFALTAELPATMLANVYATALDLPAIAEPEDDNAPVGLALFIGVQALRLTFFRRRNRD